MNGTHKKPPRRREILPMKRSVKQIEKRLYQEQCAVSLLLNLKQICFMRIESKKTYIFWYFLCEIQQNKYPLRIDSNSNNESTNGKTSIEIYLKIIGSYRKCTLYIEHLQFGRSFIQFQYHVTINL